ncbi:hypothetical protein AGMMS50230_01870 [Spirochaetia bacterium]|nr:hypothetical protein AGMMS50230_01870 [Spirochaetia bacterium]
MNQRKWYIFVFVPALLAAALLVASCNVTGGDYKSVDYDLRGTWERTEEAFWPEGQTTTSERGKLIIGFDTVKITGPVEHLQGYTRGIALEAYTEDGKLYIKDYGVWQSPILYVRAESGGYPTEKLLYLKGGGVPDKTLKRIGD